MHLIDKDIESVTKEYDPSRIIMVYDNLNYIECIDVVDGKLCNRRPLKYSDMDNFKKRIYGEYSNKKISKSLIIRREILLCGNDFCVWLIPKHIQFLHFTNMPEGKYPLPNLVLIGTQKDVFVKAIKEETLKKQNVLDWDLYEVNFPNCNTMGSMCHGNNRIKKENLTNAGLMISTWETFIFKSQFTHDGGLDSKKMFEHLLNQSEFDESCLKNPTKLKRQLEVINM